MICSPIWAGQTAVVIASGPSLTLKDVWACYGRTRVIAVNDAYIWAYFADVLYACDLEWWMHHHGAPTFTGRRISQDPAAASKWDFEHIESRPLPGLCLDPAAIHQGGNGGYQAINLAYHFGVSRILLLGFDMKPAPDGRRHFFGDHPGKLNKTSPYQKWIGQFAALARDLERQDVEVVNCSRDTALDCFERGDIGVELCRSRI